MGVPHLNPDKYHFIRALRPFSFSVALITCGLGVTLAYVSGQGDLVRGLIVLIAGVLLQAASNLANDHADLALWKGHTRKMSESVIKQIRLNFAVAIIFTLLASVMGLYLVLQVGWPLLMFGFSGIVAGYFYTGEPVHYKQYGLGVPAVFLLTGVLMISGSYYAVSTEWSNEVVLISFPVSLLASALMLSNELRDYLDDKEHGIRTLTNRIGFAPSKLLYVSCLLATYPLSYYLFAQGIIKNLWYLLISLAVIWQPISLLMCGCGDERLIRLPPLTGRFFMIFGLGFICSVL